MGRTCGLTIFVDGKLHNRPDVIIAGAMGKFDAQGNLTDEPARPQSKARLMRAQSSIAPSWPGVMPMTSCA